MKVTDETLHHAVELVRAQTGFEPGAEIDSEKLLNTLGLPKYPERREGETDRPFLKRCERHRMMTLGPLEALREKLLVEFKVDLRATGKGRYRVVPPGVQAPQAARDGLAQARKALRSAATRIEHVDTSKLNKEQLIDRDAAMLNNAARIAMLSGKPAATVMDEVRAKSRKNDASSRSAMPMPPMPPRK